MNVRSIITSLRQISRALYSHGSPLNLSAVHYGNLPSRVIFPLVAGTLTSIPDVSQEELNLTVRLSTYIYGREMSFFLRDTRFFLTRFWAWFYAYCPDFIRQFSTTVSKAEKKILTVMARTAGVSLDEVVCFNLKNRDVFQPCWVVIHQPAESRLLIVARGTLSILDGYVDLDFCSEPLSQYIEELDPQLNFYVHRGVLRATLWMYNAIVPYLHRWIDERTTQSLELGVSSEVELDTLVHLDSIKLSTSMASSTNFSLLLTGHSLGSAVTVLLSALLLLRHPNRWTPTNLKCIGYGCPPFSNAAFSDWTRDWLSLFVYDMDIVPRLGDHSLRVRACRAASYTGNLESQEPANSISRRLMTNCSLILSGRVYLIQSTSYYKLYGYSMPEQVLEASSTIGKSSLTSLSRTFSNLPILPRSHKASVFLLPKTSVQDFEARLYFVSAIDPHDFAETLLTEAAMYDHLCYNCIIPYIFHRKTE